MVNVKQIGIFPQKGMHHKNEFQSGSIHKGQLLANKIELGMKQKQYNRQKFANLMGVQPSIVTRWLSGSHNFTVETLFEIEDQLGVQLIAIQRPVYKELSYHMVVGSEETQHFNSSLVEALSIISSHITYDIEIKTHPIRKFSDHASLLEHFKILSK